MKESSKLASLYGNEYFEDRSGNDVKRKASFESERLFIERFTPADGVILDVGCSTGEFLTHIGWSGKKYGIEISEFAAEHARISGIDIVDNYDIENSLDAVVYRGTIQHLDSPFRSLEKAAKTLKPGGKVFLLATPNINSVYYRMFGTLPALDSKRNFYLPSDKSLKSLAMILGLDFVAVEYPYLHSPYSSPVADHFRFFFKAALLPLGRLGETIEFPFYRSMMNIVLAKR